jgi:hypothetical protein
MNVSSPPCPMCAGPTVIYSRRVVSALTRVFTTKAPQQDETVYIFHCECGTQFAVTVKADHHRGSVPETNWESQQCSASARLNW